MSPPTHLFAVNLVAKLGGVAGFAAAIAFMHLVNGFDWWALQPVWVTMAPLVTGGVVGLFAGLAVGWRLPALCPECAAGLHIGRGGPENVWGYWCPVCGRDRLARIEPPEPPVKG